MISAIQRFKQGFANSRIRTKIMMIYFPLLLAPLFIMGYTANTIYSNAIVDKSTQSFTENSALLISRLDGMLQNTSSAANMLALTLNRVLGEPVQSELARYNAITTQLSLALLIFPDVDSIVFIDEEGRVYGTNPRLEQHSTNVTGSAAYQRIQQTNGINYWLPMERRDVLTKDPNEVVLSLGKKIVHIQTGNVLGHLFLQVREDQLSGVLDKMNAEPAGRYFIADSEGMVVSSPDPSLLLKPIESEPIRTWVNQQSEASDIRTIEGDKSLLALSSFPQLGWKVVSVMPLSALTAGLDQLQWTILAVAAVCSLFAILGASFLSKRIARPLVELARSMKGFQEGHLEVQLEVKSRDELGYFVLGFNEMLRRIKELLNNVMLEQRKKREYELALIQSQIKPHFLYNTLDVIYALSQMNRVKEVQHMTKALADFYRAALSKGREIITLEEEIRNVRDYLAIQRIRYTDVFTYEIEMNPAIRGFPILKLTIQPLVENAIYHGLKEKEGGGHLQIKGDIEGNRILIQVADNGIGIPPEHLAGLLQPPSDQEFDRMTGDGSSSYGLRNVDDRIKLSFGSDYGLRLHSVPGEGTVVTIHLPMEWNMTGNEQDGDEQA